MFKEQECHKTLSNHSLILENKYIFLFWEVRPLLAHLLCYFAPSKNFIGTRI